MVTAARRVGTIFGLAVLPASLLAAFLVVAARPAAANEMIDFHWFWAAARDYLHGNDPYPAHPGALTWAGSARHVYAYPPILAALAAPFAVAPYHLAAILFALLSTLSIVAALM